MMREEFEILKGIENLKEGPQHGWKGIMLGVGGVRRLHVDVELGRSS